MLNALSSLLSPLSYLLSLYTTMKKRRGRARERASRGSFLVHEREGEDGKEEVERLRKCTSPHDEIFLSHERVKGEREKERVHKQRKWGRADISVLGIPSHWEQERRDGSRAERERDFEGRKKERGARQKAEKGTKEFKDGRRK